MTAHTSWTDLVNLITREMSRIPVPALAALASLAAVSEGLSYAMRSSGSDPLLIAAAVIVIISGGGVSYLASMTMVDAPRSLKGFGAYAGIAVLVALPAAAGLALLLLSNAAGIPLLVPLGLLMALVGLIAAPILCAWPILQAVSPRFIGPREAFRRTSGIRWALLLAAFALGAISRLDFPVPPGEFTAITAGSMALNALIGVISTIVAIATSVAAFKRMN